MKKVSFIFVAFAFLVTGIFFLFNKDHQPKNIPILTVYTYSSFQSFYGPGPELVKAFESTCGCKVNLVNAGDAGLILQRLKLSQDEEIDVVVGLDQFTKIDALGIAQWKPLNMQPVEWAKNFSFQPQEKTPRFVPYNWSPMTFIYRNHESMDKPSSFEDLVKSVYKKKISLEDPRMSTPGMQFLFWLVVHFGEDDAFDYYARLIKNESNVSPSWSSAYGMFTQGKANLVFSYFTSAVYHWTKEKDFTYQPLLLENVKYPVQVEYAAVPERCKHCTLANDFVNFLLSEPSQKIIMNKNIMLPVIAGVTQGSGFDQLNYGETMSQQDYEKIAPKKKELIERWSGLIRK